MKRYRVEISNDAGDAGNFGIFQGLTEKDAEDAAKEKWGSDWELYPNRSIIAL